MDSPYDPPESASEPIPVEHVDPAARSTARVLGWTAVLAGLVAAFIAWDLTTAVHRKERALFFLPVLDLGGGLIPPLAVIASGIGAIILSSKEQRYRMLGMGFASVIFALLVIGTEMWAVREVFFSEYGTP